MERPGVSSFPYRNGERRRAQDAYPVARGTLYPAREEKDGS